MTERLLLTVQEAAQTLRISRSALYELMGRGELRYVHIGSSRRILVADVLKFVERRLQGSPD